MNNVALHLDQITKTFVQADNQISVLRGCDLTLHAGDVVALVGPSGAGKSTLLHIAGLLERPSSGRITIGGVDASAADDATRTALRNRFIGYVYQMHHLLPEFSARENIMLPQMIAGVDASDAARRADELLDLVGLTPRAEHRPARLSGGEQQRVAIARALANRPQLLIADEPTGNLDPHTSDHVFTLLQHLVRNQGLALLMATHNMQLAERMGRIVTLVNGVLRHGMATAA